MKMRSDAVLMVLMLLAGGGAGWAQTAGNANQHIMLQKTAFAADEEIEVRWHGLPGNDSDWISVSPAGSSDRTWGNWWYTRGAKEGLHKVGKLAPGVYQVRVYYNWPRGGYEVHSRLDFTVGEVAAGAGTPAGGRSNQHITLEKTAFSPEEEITLRWHELPGNARDWISVVPSASPDNTWGNWWYAGGDKEGERNIGKLAPGAYQVRVYYNWAEGGYTVQSRLNFTVGDVAAAPVEDTAPPEAVTTEHVSLSKGWFLPEEQIEVRWHGLPGNAQDWIAVVPASAPDNSWGTWWYTRGEKSGQRAVGRRAPGEYEVRVYFNWPQGGYTVQSRLPFTVREATGGVG